jgi:hypothetical protein
MTRLTIYSAFLLSLLLAASSPAADEPIRDVPHPKNPKRIVYLCDASKSMKEKFPIFALELIKAVEALEPDKSFTIIFTVDGKAVALGKDLLAASSENKQKATEFIKKLVPSGISTTIPGLRAAFAVNPDVIYFATDAAFGDRDQAINETRKLNKDKRVKIDTIAFFDRGEAYEIALKQIADENAGLFKFVSSEEIKPRR